MTIKDPGFHFEDLLQHSDWVRSLARQLVVDSAKVDDLVQDTWVVALRRPPGHANNLRAWLGRVVTSLAQSSWRSESRRNVREEATAREEALPSTSDLVQQASMSRELVDGVLGLSEPFRTVLLLRYFRDMTPTQIARETGRPLPTVKTQLQRGLSKLRERFDETYCDRDSWCTALLPLALAGAPIAATTVAGLIPAAAALIGITVLAGIGVKSMSAPALAPQEAFASEGLTPPGHDSDTQREDFDMLGGDREGHSEDFNVGRVAVADGMLGDGGDQATAIPHNFELRGRVLDESGSGLNGVALEWIDPSVLQWADASKTVISGPHLWLPLPAGKQGVLQSDPEALEEFARSHFNRPGLASAFLRGDEVPRIGTTTRAGGEFEMGIPEPGIEIELVDEHWGELGTAILSEEPDRRAWFAGERRVYIADLVDEELKPVADASVLLISSLPEAMEGTLLEGTEYLAFDHSAVADNHGVLEFGSIALTPRFSALVIHDGVDVVVSIDLTERVLGEEVRFRIKMPPERMPEITLTGMVYLSDGAPAPRATIVHGDTVAISDNRGHYSIDLYSLEGDLSAARAGSGVLVMSDVGLAYSGLDGEQAGPDLRLPLTSLSLRGRVLDHRNAPIPGAWVSIVGTIPVSDQAYGLEDLAGGRTMGSSETDALGQFNLRGLLPRDYTIVVNVAQHEIRIGPLPAGMANRDVIVDLRD